jgi:hypothetical protein
MENTNKERKKRYRAKNREKHLAYSKNYNNEYYHKVRKIKDLCKKYDITIESYNEILRKFDGKCHICNKAESRNGFTALCIDHCHTTGKVRGLLCNSCNVGLGCFKDDIKLLDKAKKYLSM